MNAQVWCGLTRLHEVIERLRPRLRVFGDEGGAELFDLPDASRPDPETPAPVRFLPAYDNVLLSHADRGRFYAGGYRTPPRAGKGGFVRGVLVDGMFRATYTLTRGRDRADLLVTPFGRFSMIEEDALAEEGSRLLAFVVSGADHDVRLAPRDDPT